MLTLPVDLTFQFDFKVLYLLLKVTFKCLSYSLKCSANNFKVVATVFIEKLFNKLNLKNTCNEFVRLELKLPKLYLYVPATKVTEQIKCFQNRIE